MAVPLVALQTGTDERAGAAALAAGVAAGQNNRRLGLAEREEGRGIAHTKALQGARTQAQAGDPSALEVLSPEEAENFRKMKDNFKKSEIEEMERQNNMVANMGASISEAPPPMKGALYGQARQQLVDLHPDLEEKLPKEWGPEAAAYVEFHTRMARKTAQGLAQAKTEAEIAEKLGKAEYYGRGGASGRISTAASAKNSAIDDARERLLNLDYDYETLKGIIIKEDPTTGLLNENFDPNVKSLWALARTRKQGADPGYSGFMDRFGTPAPAPGSDLGDEDLTIDLVDRGQMRGVSKEALAAPDQIDRATIEQITNEDALLELLSNLDEDVIELDPDVADAIAEKLDEFGYAQ